MPLTHRAALLAICLIWAGNFLAAAVAVRALEPVTFTALRAAVVLLLLLPFFKRPARGQWLNLLTACWCMGALHFGLVFVALDRSADISSIAILMQVYVPISTLLAVLLLGERIGWRSTSAIALAFAGVLLVGLDPLVLGQLDVLGLVLASAFFLALGTIFMRRLSGVDVFGFQAWNALLSFVPLAALALATESPLATIAEIPLTDPVWLALGYSAVGASIVGHGTFYWLVQRHEIQSVTPFLLLVPVLAVLLGMLAWGDRPGPRLLVGGALVILGVLWVTLRSHARQRPDGPAPAADRAALTAVESAVQSRFNPLHADWPRTFTPSEVTAHEPPNPYPPSRPSTQHRLTGRGRSADCGLQRRRRRFRSRRPARRGRVVPGRERQVPAWPRWSRPPGPPPGWSCSRTQASRLRPRIRLRARTCPSRTRPSLCDHGCAPGPRSARAGLLLGPPALAHGISAALSMGAAGCAVPDR